jgi:hypothetical protein
MGKTAAMMVVWNAELAQSYMAQALSSGRPSPRRSSRCLTVAFSHRSPDANRRSGDQELFWPSNINLLVS